MIRPTTPALPRYELHTPRAQHALAALHACATLALLLGGREAAAQVNVERMRKRMDGDGFASTIEASVTGRTGNTESIVAGGAAQARAQHGDHAGLLAMRGDYARSGPSVEVQNAFAHLRYDYRLSSDLWGEVFGQLQGDAIRRLRFRSLAGLGPRLGLFRSPGFDLFVGTAYMIEREVIDVEPGAPDEPVTLAHRSSNYLSVAVVLDTRVLFSAVTYAQPRFDKPSDVRILGEASLAIEITHLIGTKIECSVRHDSEPPTGVKPTDLTLRNALTLTF